MRIGYQNNFSTDYCIENTVIEKSTIVCDLGVRMDCKLTFSNHCSHVTQRAFHTLYNLFKTFRNHDISFYLFLYTTYVKPIFDSACEVWSPRNICDIDKIERVQKHVTKHLLGLRNMQYLAGLKVIGLETLEVRRIKSDLTLLKKYL